MAASMRSQLQSPDSPAHPRCRAPVTTHASSVSSPAASPPAELHTPRAIGSHTRAPALRLRRPAPVAAGALRRRSTRIPHCLQFRVNARCGPSSLPIGCSSGSAQDSLGFGVPAAGTKSYHRRSCGGLHSRGSKKLVDMKSYVKSFLSKRKDINFQHLYHQSMN